MDAWPFQSDLTLAAMPRAAYWARRHAEETLTEWKVDWLLESVQLVVSELVSNAVTATEEMTGEMSPEMRARYSEQPSAVSYLELARLGHIRLRLSYDYTRVLIEVWDTSDRVPVMQQPTEDAEDGRGLLIVATYCARWGWYPSFEADKDRPGRRRRGKVVWGEIDGTQT
jgi:anti-sigma regulatory factor (Ser/Thr protein kinase)